MKTVKKWLSPRPTKCDICNYEFLSGDEFIDGATTMGPWGILCKKCHTLYGRGLGTGKGQKYNWSNLIKLEG